MRLVLVCLCMYGCATVQHGPYNREPESNPDCWVSYGAAIGYCGKYNDR